MISKTSALTAFACLCLLTGCTARTGENLSSSNNWTTQEKINGLLVGITINPATAARNTTFITLRNKTGEPIANAKVVVKSLRQWMFKKQENVQATYVAPGVYKMDTDLGEGVSEMNISITPELKPTTNLRIEARIDRPTAAPNSFVLIQR